MEVTVDELLKTEESFFQVNNNNDSSNDNGSGVIQNQTINYNISDKLIEQYEVRISEYREEIANLKERIKNLEDRKMS